MSKGDSRNLGRRVWHPPLRGNPFKTQAHGRDRWSANAVAHNEDVLGPWRERLRRLLRLPRLRN